MLPPGKGCGGRQWQRKRPGLSWRSAGEAERGTEGGQRCEGAAAGKGLLVPRPCGAALGTLPQLQEMFQPLCQAWGLLGMQNAAAGAMAALWMCPKGEGLSSTRGHRGFLGGWVMPALWHLLDTFCSPSCGCGGFTHMASLLMSLSPPGLGEGPCALFRHPKWGQEPLNAQVGPSEAPGGASTQEHFSCGQSSPQLHHRETWAAPGSAPGPPLALQPFRAPGFPAHLDPFQMEAGWILEAPSVFFT